MQTPAHRTIVAAVGVVITDDAGRLLLVLRARDPGAGRWSVPGGKVEPGEELRRAAEREVLEETGLTVRVTRELGTVEIPHGSTTFQVTDFAAVALGGELRAGDDAAAVRWADAGDLAALPLTAGLLAALRGFGVLRQPGARTIDAGE